MPTSNLKKSKKTKVAVIGSNSFSGSDFIDLLLEQDKYNVAGISRSPEKDPVFLPYSRHRRDNFIFKQYDLNKNLDKLLAFLDSFQPEYVVNFAAQSEVAPSWKYPTQWFQTNTVSITALANGLKGRTWLKKYVHISSPEVYGSCRGTVTEESPLNPSTPYAASKAAGDLSLFTFVKNFDFPMVMIRATNVYGPHQQLHKIIPRSAIYIRNGKTIELDGGGYAIKSFIHIRDVSCGELLAMEHGKAGEIYHLSPDHGIAVRDVVKTVCSAMNASFEQATKAVNERLGQDSAYVIDSTKAREAFGWEPTITPKEGITQVVDWVTDNWNAISKQPLVYVHKP